MTPTLVRRVALAAATLFLASGCGDGPAGPAPVESVEVTSPSQSITAGETAQLSVVTKKGDGGTLTGREVLWSSGNQAVATVNATGMVTALTPGSAVITATSEGKTGSVTLRILPVPVASVTVTPNPVEVRVGLTTELVVVARDASGNVLSGRPVTITTSSAAVAAVDANRMVTGVAAGTAHITATSEGKSATVTVTVSPGPVTAVEVTPGTQSVHAGSTVQLSAVARDASGAAVSGRQLSWTTSNPAIATVSAAGVVTGVAAGGPVSITATVEGKSASAQITVTPAPIATLTISPDPVEVKVGLSTQLVVVARDAAGNILSGRSGTLTTSNPAVATVNADREVTGVSAGTVTITATFEGKTATTTANVVPGPVASVTIAPTSPSVRVGATIEMTATLRDASEAVVTGRTITWTSTDASKATVSATGVVTGVEVGTTTITATSEGKSASTTVSVLRMPVASVRFAPFPDPFIVGDTARARAVAVDSTGREMPDRVVTFSGSNDAVATVSSSGLMSAFSAGSVTITATSEGVSATQTGSIVEVRVSYSDLTCFGVKVGATCTSSARLRYVNAFGGNVVSGIPYTITFESLDPGNATYEEPRTDRSATLRGVAPGTARTVAKYTGVNGVTRVNELAVQVYP